MIGEALTPGVIVLGIGGVAAFLVGAFFLFEGPGADIEIAVSLPLIVGAAMTTARAGLRRGRLSPFKARARPPAAGAEQMIGMPRPGGRLGCGTRPGTRARRNLGRAQTNRCDPAILYV